MWTATSTSAARWGLIIGLNLREVGVVSNAEREVAAERLLDVEPRVARPVVNEAGRRRVGHDADQQVRLHLEVRRPAGRLEADQRGGRRNLEDAVLAVGGGDAREVRELVLLV